MILKIKIKIKLYKSFILKGQIIDLYSFKTIFNSYNLILYF